MKYQWLQGVVSGAVAMALLWLLTSAAKNYGNLWLTLLTAALLVLAGLKIKANGYPYIGYGLIAGVALFALAFMFVVVSLLVFLR